MLHHSVHKKKTVWEWVVVRWRSINQSINQWIITSSLHRFKMKNIVVNQAIIKCCLKKKMLHRNFLWNAIFWHVMQPGLSVNCKHNGLSLSSNQCRGISRSHSENNKLTICIVPWEQLLNSQTLPQVMDESQWRMMNLWIIIKLEAV